MLIAITILLDILKNEGMTNCDWKANSMKAFGQTRIGFPATGLVKKSLKPKYFPDFFQLTLKRCIFAVSLNLEKV